MFDGERKAMVKTERKGTEVRTGREVERDMRGEERPVSAVEGVQERGEKGGESRQGRNERGGRKGKGVQGEGKQSEWRRVRVSDEKGGGGGE